MRRAVTTLLLAIAIVSPLAAQPAATSAPTTRYTRLYVFGDSYSDIGAGYIDGNGPTAVAYLGWLMGLQVASSKAANAGGKSLVFAVSGAGTGEGAGRPVKDALLGYGMMNQVRDFAARVKSGELTFDPQTTLFFLAGGLNDGRRETAVTLDNLRQQLTILRELGARHVTIARLPTKIPQFAAVGLRLNPAYEQFVRDEAAPGLDLWLNHWGAAFDDVMQRPSAHGIVNTTSACAGRAIFDQDPTPVGDPATCFFYHEGHPSTAVHRIVGKKLFEEIAARTGTPRQGLEFIDTGFENASPLWYEVDGDVIRINLLYDHERSSPNRAAGHIHFLLHAKPGSKLTLEFRNLDNVWNGQPGSVAGELKTVAISEDGRSWRTVPTDSLPGNRVQLTLDMRGAKLYVARIEPYRLSDLDRLLTSIRGHRSVRLSSIGKTVAGRDLELIRIGDPAAPYRVFVRARAHPWESGSNWVAEGLIRQLLKDDEHAKRFLKVFSVAILPMANKDGVARGGTRFNLNGKDLNRNWDTPADPRLAPENAALEKWLEGEIAAGRPPHLAMELHNDGSGRLHISRPPVPQLARHLERMTVLEELLRKHTWFTEGSTNTAFRNSGTLGDGWLQRYGIDAVVHEFNCNWIAGLEEHTSAAHWKAYGEKLAAVFHDYFVRVKP